MKKWDSEPDFVKDGWSPETVNMVVARLLDDKTKMGQSVQGNNQLVGL